MFFAKETHKVIQCYNADDIYQGKDLSLNPYKILEYTGPEPRPPTKQSSDGNDHASGHATIEDNLMAQAETSNDIRLVTSEYQVANEINGDLFDADGGYAAVMPDQLIPDPSDPMIWYAWNRINKLPPCAVLLIADLPRKWNNEKRNTGMISQVEKPSLLECENETEWAADSASNKTEIYMRCIRIRRFYFCATGLNVTRSFHHIYRVPLQ